MMKQFKTPLIFIVLLIVNVSSAFCLEKLSTSEMRKSTAQAGISLAVSDTVMYNSEDSIRLTNLLEPDSYVEFSGMESMTVINCGVSDVDGDDFIGHITIDAFTETDETSPVYGQPFLAIKAEDLEVDSSTTIDAINLCGTDIGSLKVDNNTLQSFHVYLGAHDGCGIDAEFGFRSRTGSVDFQYNDTPTAPDTGKLTVTGQTFANSFAGTESDPSTWEAAGEFQIGDVENGNPVVIDISSGNDDNPNPHISLQIGAIAGSMRIENINFGGNDMGSVIVDGIDIQQFDIEFPGRGLGRP